jgi:hypothetical protein
MKAIRMVLAIATFVATGSALATGAIAVDDRKGQTEPGYGLSLGHKSKERAEQGALTECRNAGNRDCKVAVWFESCGAYASSKRYFGIGWGANLGSAKAMALQKCGRDSCEVRVARCE